MKKYVVVKDDEEIPLHVGESVIPTVSSEDGSPVCSGMDGEHYKCKGNLLVDGSEYCIRSLVDEGTIAEAGDVAKRNSSTGKSIKYLRRNL